MTYFPTLKYWKQLQPLTLKGWLLIYYTGTVKTLHEHIAVPKTGVRLAFLSLVARDFPLLTLKRAMNTQLRKPRRALGVCATLFRNQKP